MGQTLEKLCRNNKNKKKNSKKTKRKKTSSTKRRNSSDNNLMKQTNDNSNNTSSVLNTKTYPITNDYRITTKQLGTGVNGIVYLCIKKTSKKKYAVKVMTK
jgi:hypothetical protein